MSRHPVSPAGYGHHVTVGWDPGLRSFFAQVYETESEDAPPAYSTGTTPQEHLTLVEFLGRVRALAIVDDATAVQLLRDRKQEGPREPVR